MNSILKIQFLNSHRNHPNITTKGNLEREGYGFWHDQGLMRERGTREKRRRSPKFGEREKGTREESQRKKRK